MTSRPKTLKWPVCRGVTTDNVKLQIKTFGSPLTFLANSR